MTAVKTAVLRRHSLSLADDVSMSPCACGAKKGPCQCAPTPSPTSASTAALGATPMRTSFASTPAVRLRRTAVPFGPDRDPIHQPLLDEYRRQQHQPPGGVDASGTRVGPSDAQLKYSGALGLMSTARWLSPVINPRNFARVLFDSRPLLGTPAGLTTQFVNGQQVETNLDVMNAIPEPTISTATEGGTTRCWFTDVVRATGNTQMDILTTGPWRIDVPTAEAAARFSGSQQCQGGSGTTTVTVASRPDDAAMETGVQRGEQEHDDDTRDAFLANVARYAANVTALNGTSAATRAQGADANACRIALRQRANRDLLTQFVLDLNAATARRHAGGRHSVSQFQIDIDATCGRVTFHADAPRL